MDADGFVRIADFGLCKEGNANHWWIGFFFKKCVCISEGYNTTAPRYNVFMPCNNKYVLIKRKYEQF